MRIRFDGTLDSPKYGTTFGQERWGLDSRKYGNFAFVFNATSSNSSHIYLASAAIDRLLQFLYVQ